MPNRYNGPTLPVSRPKKRKSASGGAGTIIILIIIAVLAVLIVKSALNKNSTTYVPGTVKDVNAWAYTTQATPTPEPLLAPTAEASGQVPVYYKANTAKKQVAITVQDISSASDVDKVLGICSTYGFHVTFFLTGEELSSYASCWPAAVLGGHEIESRGMTAVSVSSLSANELAASLDTFVLNLRNLIGTDYAPHFYRPADMNDYDSSVLHKALSDRNYYGIASWSLAAPSSISQIEAGQIIQISLTSYGTQKLSDLMAALSANGLSSVTMNSLFEYPENLVSTEEG